MPDRSFPAVDNLIRRAQRAAAGRPDPARILAQTISMACPGGADPYAVLGVLIEGTVQTLVEHIPKCDTLGLASPEIGDLRYGPNSPSLISDSTSRKRRDVPHEPDDLIRTRCPC